MELGKTVIPINEYSARWEKVRSLMKELELDIVLAYADDRAGAEGAL